jgi:hypothetical protein
MPATEPTCSEALCEDEDEDGEDDAEEKGDRMKAPARTEEGWK